MGCDIHIVLERKLGTAEWLGIWCSDVGSPARRSLVAQRDYGLFGYLAAVRGAPDGCFYPRNLPVDVSRLAWLQYMQAPTDYHNPSWLTLDEFIGAFNKANPAIKSESYRPEFAAFDLFGLDPGWPAGAEYRLVFWFDN